MDGERPQDDGYDTWPSNDLGRIDEAAVMRRVQDDPAYLRSRNSDDLTPLQRAIASNLPDLVEFMLKQGADTNVRTDEGYTCLLMAIESDEPSSVRMVSLLIEAGADLRGTGGRGPLHMAAGRGLIEKVRLLLDAGADVNQREDYDDNDTPLIAAARGGYVEVVRLLLDRGADPTMRNQVTDWTPLESAAAGIDRPDVYGEILNESTHNVLKMFESASVAPELFEMMKSYAMEMVRKHAEKRARDVDHRKVVQILAEYQRTER